MNQPVFICWKKALKNKLMLLVLPGWVALMPSAGAAMTLPQKSPVTLSASLFEAAKSGNVNQVIQLLGKKVPADSLDIHGGTPLFLAAGSGREKIVEILIRAGANPNHRAKDGWRPLIIASQQGQLKAVKKLLQMGANPKLATDGGMTALHAGVKNIEIVKMLLNYGASLKAVDGFGHTVLYTAAAGGNEKVFDYLVKLGEKPVQRMPNGYSTFHWAVRNNWENKVLSMIKMGAGVNWRARDGYTPLLLAMTNENKRIEKILKNHGATIEGLADKN